MHRLFFLTSNVMETACTTYLFDYLYFSSVLRQTAHKSLQTISRSQQCSWFLYVMVPCHEFYVGPHGYQNTNNDQIKKASGQALTFGHDYGTVVEFIEYLAQSPFVMSGNLVVAFEFLVFLRQHDGRCICVLNEEKLVKITDRFLANEVLWLKSSLYSHEPRVLFM